MIALAFERYGGDLAEKLRHVALMGGIGPGVFLVQQLFAFMTAGIGIVIVRRSRRHDYAPPVAILVPAHNEAHLIAATIAAFFDHARLVEVLVRHGFFQLSLLGYDGILGIPGMFLAYRKAALDRAGAIVQGMNGVDTDICLRMSAAGYRSLAEPAAIYHSETPRTWAHMREQRTRWFRSIYHLAGHNRHTIFGRQTMAGAIVLPLQLVNAARRTMLAPMLIYATLVLVVFPSLLPGLRWQPIVATVVGLPALMTVMICLLHRRWRAVLYVPHYLVFRIVRSYFTIAAVLSLVYPPIEPRLPGRRGRTSGDPGSR